MMLFVPTWEQTPRHLRRWYPYSYRAYVLWFMAMARYAAYYQSPAVQGNC